MSSRLRFERVLNHMGAKKRMHDLVDKIDERSTAVFVADGKDGTELASLGPGGYVSLLLQRGNLFIVNQTAEVDEDYQDHSDDEA